MRGLLALLALAACTEDRPRRRPPREVPVAVQAETEALARDLDTLDAALAALPPRPPKQAPDLVLIVLDTLRADRVGAYGAPAGLTPALDAFAAEATVFTQMRATGPWTLPSHASFFTGLHPLEHGARGSPADAEVKALALGEGPPTLAERLRDAGWRTLGLAANLAFLDSAWGLARGFELWLCERLSPGEVAPYVQGDRLAALARRALERRPAGQPVFLFLNFMDAHAPWVPREGYTARPERIDPAHLPGAPFWADRRPGTWARRRVEILSLASPPRPAELRSWREAYDAEVRWLDARVGELLQALPALGIGPEDYVVITSDHGEFLGEHALLEHSKDLYEEVLRVPLMVRGPGFTPGPDPRPVEGHELADLLLAALGQPPLGDEVPGLDPLQVSELYWTRHRELDDPALRARFNRVRRAFVHDGRKLILSSDGQHEAYDLRADPGEARSLAGQAPWEAELEALARDWLEARTPAAEGEGPTLDAAQEARLRSLGYLD